MSSREEAGSPNRRYEDINADATIFGTGRKSLPGGSRDVAAEEAGWVHREIKDYTRQLP